MKKHIIIFIASVFLASALFYLSFSFLIDGVNKEKNKYESKLGETFILDGDTTTIVDYSSIMETFTLSNGKTISSSLILK